MRISLGDRWVSEIDREPQPVIAKPGDQEQRIDGLPMTVAVECNSLEDARDIALCWGNYKKLRELVAYVEVSILEPSPCDDFVRIALPNLLQLGCVDVHFAAVIEGQNELIESVCAKLLADDRLSWIINLESVLKSASQKKSVTFPAPLVMPSCNKQRFLRFFSAQADVRVILIVILAEVPSPRAVVNSLQV